MKAARGTIYYFSGTGNALNAARWMREEASSRGIDITLEPVDRFDARRVPLPGTGTPFFIGFLYATHGFSLPFYMLRFILGFPRLGRAPAFLVNTFGGTKAGRFHLPGLSGLALILPALVLVCKGYRVRGLLSLNLPSNWITLHPGFNDTASRSLHDHCRKKIARFSNAFFGGKRSYSGLISLPFDLAIIPVALGYNLVGRFWLAKMYLPSRACNGCGICAAKCPVGAIVMKRGRPFWSYRCENCMRCINLCPTRAVDASHVFIIGTAAGWYGFAFPALARLARGHFPDLYALATAGHWGAVAIRAALFLAVLFALYRLVHILVKWEPFHFLLLRTSPTHYWRRYLSRGIRSGDFRGDG